jgi:hypothetical protein
VVYLIKKEKGKNKKKQYEELIEKKDEEKDILRACKENREKKNATKEDELSFMKHSYIYKLFIFLRIKTIGTPMEKIMMDCYNLQAKSWGKINKNQEVKNGR